MIKKDYYRKFDYANKLTPIQTKAIEVVESNAIITRKEYSFLIKNLNSFINNEITTATLKGKLTNLKEKVEKLETSIKKNSYIFHEKKPSLVKKFNLALKDGLLEEKNTKLELLNECTFLETLKKRLGERLLSFMEIPQYSNFKLLLIQRSPEEMRAIIDEFSKEEVGTEEITLCNKKIKLFNNYTVPLPYHKLLRKNGELNHEFNERASTLKPITDKQKNKFAAEIASQKEILLKLNSNHTSTKALTKNLEEINSYIENTPSEDSSSQSSSSSSSSSSQETDTQQSGWFSSWLTGSTN